MSNKCSLAIAPCKSLAGAIAHNRQRDKLDYVIPNGEIFTHENQSIKNLDLANVHKYEREQIADLEQIIKDKTGRKSQVKDFYLDGLISLGRETFENLTSDQRLQLHKKIVQFVHQEFKQKLNANIQYVSFHYDEGHKNDNGEWIKNPHIQFTVENVNRDTGKSINRTITKAQLKNLQTSLANQLSEFGFERGRDYSANNEQAPKQVYWKDYKRQQEALSKDKNIEQINSLKSENQQLQQENNDLKTQLKELDESYKKARQELKDSGQATQQDYKQLKESKELLTEFITPKLSTETKTKISDAIQKMITSAYKEGRKSFALSLESMNDSFTGSMALKSLKKPPIETIVSYKPDKSATLNLIEQSIQPIQNTKSNDIRNEQPTTIISEQFQQQIQIINNQETMIQELNKKLVDEKEKTMQSTRLLDTRLDYQRNLNNTLQDEKVKLTNQNETLKNEIKTKNEKITILENENKELINAINRLFNTKLGKYIKKTSKTIVERLKDIFNNIDKEVFVFTNLTRNEDVLKYYERIDPELIATCRKDGYATLKQSGFVPSYLPIDSSTPRQLAEHLGKITGHELEYQINTYQKSR